MMRKRIIACGLAVLMVFGMVGVVSAAPAAGATMVMAGTVGEGGAPWRLFDDGTVIVGRGQNTHGGWGAWNHWLHSRISVHEWEYWEEDGYWEYDCLDEYDVEDVDHGRSFPPPEYEGGLPHHRVTAIVFTAPFNAGHSANYFFAGFPDLVRIEGLHHWDTSGVLDMSMMFMGSPVLNNLDLSGFDMSNVHSAWAMFSGTHGLTNLNVSGWDVSNLTDMSMMFEDTGLVSLDLSSWNVSEGRSMSMMFANSRNLERLDLSGWNTSDAWGWRMFDGLDALRSITLGRDFSFGESGENPLPEGVWRNGDFVFTSQQLMEKYDGSTMAGTWAWYEVELRFEDVDFFHWAYDAVEFVAENGIMTGVADSLFEPDGTLSRAMMAAILYRIAGEPEVEFADVFDDVTAGKWYSNAVIWAYESGIVQGNGMGQFAPNDEVSREQLAVMLHRFAEVNGEDVDVAEELGLALWYADSARVSDWAMDAMQWAIDRGLISGGGQFGEWLNPLWGATRAESAMVLYRWLDN